MDAILSKTDIAALRKAQRIVFQMHEDGRTELRALFDFEHTNVTPYKMELFPEHNHGQEFQRRIAAESSITDYSARHSDQTRSVKYAYTGFELLNATQFDLVWRTAVTSLKAGEWLVLRWIGSNNNALLNDAGLHHDELVLQVRRRVYRKGDSQVVRREYALASQISLNNSARMLRRREVLANV
jgi:hypothetical protein